MKISELEQFNKWWKTGKVPLTLLQEYKRPLFFELLRYLRKRWIVSIVGLRRVGKTTLMYQLINELLKEVEPHRILYYSFDEKGGDINDVLESYRENILGKSWEDAGKVYIFLDEIQKTDDWQNKIKKYYDLYPNIKFVISGSAGIMIEKKVKESLAGRLFDFYLKPLSFSEFVSLNLEGVKDKIQPVKPNEIDFDSIESTYKRLALFEDEMKACFNEFVKKGGFPEMVKEKDLENVKRYVRNAVIEKIIFKDIPLAFRIEEPQLLETLLRLVANEPGMTTEYISLAKDLKKDRVTISNYFFYLQRSYLLRFLSSFRGRYRVSSRKAKRAYLEDIGVILALMEREVTDDVMGKIVENLVITSLEAKSFWKNSYDVDCVITKGNTFIPVEVKYREHISSSDIKGILSFLKKFKMTFGIIITKNLFKREKVDGIEVLYIPAWLILTMVWS
jgi:hypothetical protein